MTAIPNATSSAGDRWLSVEELAAQLGKSPRLVRELCASGAITGARQLRRRGRWMIPRAAVDGRDGRDGGEVLAQIRSACDRSSVRHEIRTDRLALFGPARRPKISAEGIVEGVARREGLLRYQRLDGTRLVELVEFVPRESLAETAATLLGRPATLNHPVDASGRGRMLEEGERGVGPVVASRVDGEAIIVGIRIDDGFTRSLVKRGELMELSVGYHVEIEERAGLWRGQRYDAIQKTARANHIALLPPGAGRCGASCSLRADAIGGASCSCQTPRRTMDPNKIADLERRLAQAGEIIAGLRAELSQLTAGGAPASAPAPARADARDFAPLIGEKWRHR